MLIKNFFLMSFISLAILSCDQRKETIKKPFIDSQTGKWIVPFDVATESTEGLAAAVIGNKVGFVNKEGNVVIGPKFDSALPFSEGLAPVYIRDKWGYIDKTGKIVIQPRFKMATSFNREVAYVFESGKYFWINKNGKAVKNPFN